MRHSPGKTKADVIRHLVEDHAPDHPVLLLDGGTRLATQPERRQLYAAMGWTVPVLIERHAMFHEANDAT